MKFTMNDRVRKIRPKRFGSSGTSDIRYVRHRYPPTGSGHRPNNATCGCATAYDAAFDALAAHSTSPDSNNCTTAPDPVLVIALSPGGTTTNAGPLTSWVSPAPVVPLIALVSSISNNTCSDSNAEFHTRSPATGSV
jgi:hypothetical protein